MGEVLVMLAGFGFVLAAVVDIELFASANAFKMLLAVLGPRGVKIFYIILGLTIMGIGLVSLVSGS